MKLKKKRRKNFGFVTVHSAECPLQLEPHTTAWSNVIYQMQNCKSEDKQRSNQEQAKIDTSHQTIKGNKLKSGHNEGNKQNTNASDEEFFKGFFFEQRIHTEKQQKQTGKQIQREGRREKEGLIPQIIEF